MIGRCGKENGTWLKDLARESGRMRPYLVTWACSVGHNDAVKIPKKLRTCAVLGLEKLKYLGEPTPTGVLIHEELGAGIPVGAGADESAALGLLKPGAFQFASLAVHARDPLQHHDPPSHNPRS
jgi:hypothetical protein